MELGCWLFDAIGLVVKSINGISEFAALFVELLELGRAGPCNVGSIDVVS